MKRPTLQRWTVAALRRHLQARRFAVPRLQRNLVWDAGRAAKLLDSLYRDMPIGSVRGSTVKLPNMGGNLPLANIERPLGTRTIIVPIGNHDNNQHSFDENLRLQNLWDRIDLMAALLTM
jgi:uncharacterized protein with ParB-like and HNH nuclease domain